MATGLQHAAHVHLQFASNLQDHVTQLLGRVFTTTVAVGLGGNEMRTILFFGSSPPPAPAIVARPGGLRGGGISAFGCSLLGSLSFTANA